MLQQQKLFALSQLLALDGKGVGSDPSNHRDKGPGDENDPVSLRRSTRTSESIVDFSASDGGDLVVFVTSEGRVVSADLSAKVPTGRPAGRGEDRVRFLSLPWYRSDRLSPRCVAFNPENDFVALCSKSGQLFVIPTQVLAPEFVPKGRDINHRDWSSSTITCLPNKSDASIISPSSLLWWSTHEFRSFGILGTVDGDLLCIDLTTGEQSGVIKICNHPLIHLQSITDNALDCTYLLISTQNGPQFRLLLEQRSSGYCWCSQPSQASQAATKSTSEESLSTAASGRSRLSGLKQFSAAGLANLRNKINEGRRMLDRRMSASVSSVTSSTSNIELGIEAVESLYTPQNMASKIGDTKVSVERSLGGLQMLVGLFPDTAVMTMHNCELEVMPQSAFKLPRGSERVLLMNKVMLVSTLPREESSDTCQLHLVSTHHAELQVEANAARGAESIIQTFTLSTGEIVLALFKCQLPCKSESDEKEESSHINLSPSNSTSFSSQQSTPSKSPCRPGLSEFSQRLATKVAQSKAKSRALFGHCIVVTNQAMYLLHMDQDPTSTFLDLSMRGGDLRKAEHVALSFGLGMKHLFELAADIRLCEKDFTSAISLYRQAGCKHLKVVLKFASSSFIQELLSYLTVLFKTPNLEVTPADRIHLSNLALMAYFQQVLTKTTPTARIKFQEQIRRFLDENSWFDECLAVRLASETREWDLLSHISQTRGLNYEMVESIVAILLGRKSQGSNDIVNPSNCQEVTKSMKEMSSMERNGLLACILHPDNAESVVFNKQLAHRLFDILGCTLTLLEEAGLQSVLVQCGPGNAGLRHAYLPLLINKSSEAKETQTALLNLTISSALLLLKKQCRVTSCDIHPKLNPPAKGPIPDWNFNEVPLVKVEVIAAGASHVLLKKQRSVLTWGMTSNGVLGHGATGSRFSGPKTVEFFSPAINVVSVACGKAHSLALTNFGLYAWGSSKQGQLGLGRQRLNEQRPILVKAFEDLVITAIAAGQYHSVVLDSTGQIWTWGWGVHGQLGLGDIEDEFEPRRVCRLRQERVTQISCGYAHTLVLTQAAEVWVFGCALFGQLGNGETKKSTVPIKVSAVPERIRLISSGYFHNIVVSAESDTVYLWGCNPQILRLEAQQKKRQRLLVVRKDMELQQQDQQQMEQSQNSTSLLKDIKKQARQALEDIRNHECSNSVVNGASENGTNELTRDLNSKNDVNTGTPNGLGCGIVSENEEDDLIHLVPGLVDTRNIKGKIVGVKCGNQHSLLLTDGGAVYAFGRNIDGQLGTNSRKEEKCPVQVNALQNDVICHIECGGDYSLAVSESGTVFAWGSNSSGQLGRVPLNENEGDSSKIVVMKATKRVIRLQNNVQNICDVPRPVGGITSGIYSEDALSLNRKECEIDNTRDMLLNLQHFANFQGLDGTENVERLLHLSLETFFGHLDVPKVIKKCLIADNPLAAAKLSLLTGNVLQAFEFTLQLSIKQSSINKPDNPMLTLERIFNAFVFYLRETKGIEDQLVEQRKQLLERLIACWQDQKFSFLQLENLCLTQADPLLLQTLVLTLFCPEEERDTQHGPVLDEDSGPKLVDLFTPEFCLKIGDTFVKEMKLEKQSVAAKFDDLEIRNEEGRFGRKASEVAGEWLKKKSEVGIEKNF